MNTSTSWRGLRARPGGGRLAAALAVVAALAGPLAAARSSFWTLQTYADYAAGKVRGVAVTAVGELELAPTVEPLARLPAERVWSLAAGPDGTVYAGTGDEGRVYVVDRQGRDSLLFDSPELAVHALAVGTDGTVYAGTAPDGLIYAVDGQGRVTTRARTGSHYVWDLAAGPEGVLYVAAGDTARVLAVSRQGEVRSLAVLPEQHAMALRLQGDRLWVATARPGRVYEIDPAAPGRARLLAETGYEEVNALVPGERGALYAAAVTAPADPPEKGKEEQRSAVFRLDPGGAVYPVWQADDALLLDLEADATGRLILAAGEPGRLYRVAQDRAADLVAQFEEYQPSRLARGSDGVLYIGAAGSGRVERLGVRAGREGEYESPVHDYEVQCHWGALGFLAGEPGDSQVSIQTRSGNSESPDDTWSAWSEPVSASGRPVASPPARFLQLMVRLRAGEDGRGPRVRRVTVAAAPANLRPAITDLQVTPFRSGQTGGEGQEAATAAAPPERPGGRMPTQRKSLRLVRWQAQDPNGDRLYYRVYLRGAGQREWKLVEEDLTVTMVTWDTEDMPEGLTELKLVASDRGDNPPDQELEDERLATPFVIDNTPPVVELSAAGSARVAVEVVARDRVSPIQRIQSTVDYQDPARQVGPADGLYDDLEERARFEVAGLAPGEHVIGVQAWDALDNIGVQQVVVQVR